MLIIQATGGDSTTIWLDYIQSAGVLGLLVLLFIAIMTRRIVPGWTYDAMEADRNYYREVAHKSIELADRQITVAEILAERTELLENREAVLSRRSTGRRKPSGSE